MTLAAHGRPNAYQSVILDLWEALSKASVPQNRRALSRAHHLT